MEARDRQGNWDGRHLLSGDKVEYMPSIERESPPPTGNALEEFFAVLSVMAWNG